MAMSEVGLVSIGTFTGGTLGITALTGYVSPRIDALSVNHNNDVVMDTDVSGDIVRLSASGEYLECQMTLIPDGTSQANALKAGGKPVALAGVTITGLPIVAMGSWSNAWNTNGSDSPENHQWIYIEGSSRIEKPDRVVLDMTLRRFVSSNLATGK